MINQRLEVGPTWIEYYGKDNIQMAELGAILYNYEKVSKGDVVTIENNATNKLVSVIKDGEIVGCTSNKMVQTIANYNLSIKECRVVDKYKIELKLI
jgi:hypothetical protein